MAHPQRRRKLIGHRRQVEDEVEEGPDVLDADDDSVTDGSVGTDDNNNEAGNGSDTSNVDELSPTSPRTRSRRTTKGPNRVSKSMTDTDVVLHGLSVAVDIVPVAEINFDDVAYSTQAADAPGEQPTAASKAALDPPVVVSSGPDSRQQLEPLEERRWREHEEYRKKRDEDPSFVPNRGFFFMHDHRQQGPMANGYRPFGKVRGRGGARGGGLVGPFPPMSSSQMSAPSDPTISAQWAHDLHDTIADPPPRYQPRAPRHLNHVSRATPSNGGSFIPTCLPSAAAIDRAMSTDRALGKVQVRVWLPGVTQQPLSFPGILITQYTKLPDHRPPLRRDKAVRISLPNGAPRFILPAEDRSFIFIPRALRPNQQRLRGRPRSGLGSVGGYSRRTSIVGGSYYGSVYTPSVAMSRRSSIAQDGRDMFSPTGLAISRVPISSEGIRPVVRLPPQPTPTHSRTQPPPPSQAWANVAAPVPVRPVGTVSGHSPLHSYPISSKPTPREPRLMASAQVSHQPGLRNIGSANDISLSSPTPNMRSTQAFQQAFHQQVPVGVSNGMPSHVKEPQQATQHPVSAYQSLPPRPQRPTGTPLSQIPERAIHAAPFQPNIAGDYNAHLLHQHQQNFGYGQPAYGIMQQQPHQGYYLHPQAAAYTNTVMGQPMPPFMPNAQPPPPPQQQQQQQQHPQENGHAQSNLVAQEVNGMVYYFDASQLPPPPPINMMASFTGYAPGSGLQGYGPNPPSVMGMGAPGPEMYFYPGNGAPPGTVFYSQ